MKISNEMLHNLCAVTWYDACGKQGGVISKAKPVKEVNWGWLSEIHRKHDPIPYIVLQTSFSPDEPEEDAFDYTVIPTTLITKMEIMKV